MTLEIQQAVPSHFRNVTGKNLPALLKASNVVWKSVQDVIEACIDQLFIPTAEGRYLVNLGEEQGFTLPKNSGLDIRAYRALVPIMVSAPKQVRVTIEELVSAFYGNDRTHPVIRSSVPGPYQLQDGDDLIVETESGAIRVSITSTQVSNLNSVSAGEIAAVLNSVQTSYLADTYLDRTTGASLLRLISRSTGAGASIRVAGGTLQNVLRFPMLAATANVTGTTFSLTQMADLIRFTWDGAGANPLIYLVRAGDVVTIRDLVDVGPDQFSLLNGSYTAVDVGYDYFELRNSSFFDTPSTLVQPTDTAITFTSKERLTLFNLEEYAFVTETGVNSLTVTVPAVPPLARRFLAGSAHIHGFEAHVLDFTRTTLQFQQPIATDRPASDQQFLLGWRTSRYDFRGPRYLSLDISNSPTQPTFIVESSDEDYAFLPYTANFPIGSTRRIMGTIGSDELIVQFDFKHGLYYGWGFTLSGANAGGGITAPQLNREHRVYRVIDDHTISFRAKTAGGLAVTFAGIPWGPADVYQHTGVQSDGSDMWLQFPSALAATASGLTPGTLFRLNTSGGVDVVPSIANKIRFRNLEVKSVVGANVNFYSAIGTGTNGVIITGVSGVRSGGFGGSAINYRFDKTTSHNSALIASMMLTTVGYQASSNPLYVGSFLYDENGLRSTLKVGQQIVRLTTQVLRGANVVSLMVDGSDFPQSGNLVMEFGSDRREGPIRFFATVANSGQTQILIDPAYRFQKTHRVGAEVQVVTDLLPHRSIGDGSDYPVYLTGTTAARNTMFDLIEQLVAAGVFVNRDVILPNLRFADTAVAPFD